MKTYSPIAIANWFILKADKEQKYLDLIKLLKLIYIAQGFALARKDTPIINAPIEAWKYGPVIREVYQEFKKYGTYSIGEPSFKDAQYEVDKFGSPTWNCFIENVDEHDSDAVEILTDVWENFSEFTGIQLSNWSHENGGPWYQAWHLEKGKEHINHPISQEKISSYFKRVLGCD